MNDNGKKSDPCGRVPLNSVGVSVATAAVCGLAVWGVLAIFVSDMLLPRGGFGVFSYVVIAVILSTLSFFGGWLVYRQLRWGRVN